MICWRVPLVIAATTPLYVAIRSRIRRGLASVRTTSRRKGLRIPFADVFVTADPIVVSKLVRTLMASHSPGIEIIADPVSGGITNKLFCASLVKDGRTTRVLVRIFGAEGTIERGKENATFDFLGDCGISTRCLGRFRNGRLEEWLEGYKALTLNDLSHAETSRGIAQEMAKLHLVKVPADLKGQYYPQEGSGLWDELDLWLNIAKAQDPDAKDCKLNAAEKKKFRQLDLNRITREIRNIQGTLEARDCAVTFCHNDCLYGNIMRHTMSGAIRLIDFEYGGFNYSSFDIANHFNEWGGGTGTEKSGPGYNGVPDYTLLPSRAQQHNFCRAYLEQIAVSTGGEATSETAVQALLGEVNQFILVNHFYWGVWGLNQAFKEGCGNFDYMQYGCSRISKYFALKVGLDDSLTMNLKGLIEPTS